MSKTETLKVGNSLVEKSEENLFLANNSRVEGETLYLEEGINYVHRFAPKVAKGNDTLGALYEAFREEAEYANITAKMISDNTHVQLTNLRGVQLWEGVLKLKANETLDLAARREMILLKRRFYPPFTRQNLGKILNSVWGVGNYTFAINPNEFEVEIDIDTNYPEIYLRFEQYVREIIPANMYVVFSVQYTHTYLKRHFSYVRMQSETYEEFTKYEHGNFVPV